VIEAMLDSKMLIDDQLRGDDHGILTGYLHLGSSLDKVEVMCKSLPPPPPVRKRNTSVRSIMTGQSTSMLRSSSVNRASRTGCIGLLRKIGPVPSTNSATSGKSLVPTRRSAPLFNGSYYRILTKPGRFAILAYPAEYRNSGIMTFIIGKDGVVYQKDLGEKTGDVALAMTEFNLADGWSPAVSHCGNALRAQR
jgi:hypothetical protein